MFCPKLKFVSSKCFDIIQSFQLCQTLAEKACEKTTQSENSFSAQIYLASYQNLNPEGSETPTTTEWEAAAGIASQTDGNQGQISNLIFIRPNPRTSSCVAREVRADDGFVGG